MRSAIKLWSAAAAALCSLTPQTANASTLTLTPNQDSFVQYGTPATNYGSVPVLLVENAGATGAATSYGLLKFSLSKIDGSQILGATLRLYGESGNSTPDTVAVYKTGTYWTENGVTWNNKPTVTVDGGAPTSSIGSTMQYYTWNMAGLMPTSTVSTSNDTLSVALEMTNKPSSGRPDVFYSRTLGSNPPQIVINYNAPPTVKTAAAANPGAVTGTSTALSVLGADDGGEANLTYTWSSTGPAPVTFSADGTNAAKNCTATFGAGGNYVLTATITDAGGLKTTSSVDVSVDETLNGSSPQVTAAPTGVMAWGYSRETYLTWTAVSGATSYNIYRSTTSGGEGATPVAAGVSTHSYLDTGLTNGTTYYYEVTAVGAVESPKSTEVWASPALPTAPSPISAVAISSTAIDVTWRSQPVTSWEVFRGATPGGEGSTPYKTIQEPFGPVFYPGATPTFVDTNMTGGTFYYYVVAVSGSDTSPPSNEVSATVYGPPFGLTATPGDTAVSLSWSPCGGATSYGIYRGTAPGAEASTAVGSTTSTAFTDTGLTDGVAYYYVVKAVYPSLTSGPSNEASATPVPPIPPAPSGLAATPGDKTAALTWTASAGATSYNIYRGTTPGGESSTAVGSTSGTTFTDTGLTDGTTYYYVVKAVNLGGTSPASNEASAMPEPPAPPAPTGLTASGSAAQIALSWTASAGATSYNVYRGTSTGGESATPFAVGQTTTSFTDTGVVNGVTYYYTVAAVAAGGTSGPSNEASASTTPFSLDINCGGAAASPFVADIDYSGGSKSSSSNAIDTSLLTGTVPPQAVLQSNRYGTYTYTIPGLNPGGLYNVTLYFAEEYWTAAGKRVFNVSINGSPVLSNFDIYAGAGAEYKAIQRSFPVTADGSGNIAVSTAAVKDNPQINGIAVASGSGGMAPLAPSNLTAQSSGLTILLNWNPGSGATSYNIYRSTTSGGEGSTPYAVSTGNSYTDTNVTAGTTYYYTVAAANPSGSSAASNEASAAPVQPGPYGGTPVQLPGTVEAENYDVGGFNSGYYVTSVNGSANNYRPDGVDLEITQDNGGGYDLGWSSTGQWFNYTVEVVSAGPYTVSFRVAAGGTGGSFHLQDATGNNLTGSVSVAGTGGWQNWATVTADVTLPVGIQTLKFVQDTGGYNVNNMSFAWAGTPGPTNLAASGENQKVFLTWTGVGTATSYDIYRGTTPAGESTTPIATNVTGTTFTDTNVTNGTAYYYTVAGVTSSGLTGMSNESSATPATEGPYGGTPWPIPGMVQVENYDVGGEGAGYHDTDATNDGGQYRTDGVDIEQTTDLLGGYDVGWTAPGEWLNYTVNVASSGSYVIQTRVACNGPGGTFHYNVDGAVATSEITVPDTGGWQFWDTVSTSISLTAGQHVIQLSEDTAGSGGLGNFNWFAVVPPSTGPNFGSNVFIFNPSMSASYIQNTVNAIFSGQQFSQFGSNRCALLFAPGTYNVDVPVGYYTQVLGLGLLPDDTLINGYVQQSAALSNNNATCNFWTGVENLAVNPVDSGGTDMWAVSQADPMRRVHVEGNLVLTQNGGWGSGGFISDTAVDNTLNFSSQQQWITRNSQIGGAGGGSWNVDFVGVNGAPATNFPTGSYTTVAQTPVSREKPFLTVDGSGNYSVFVPAVQTNSSGTTWGGGSEAGQYIPISQFYIAQPGVDTADTINAALGSGLNLLFTPGIYILTGTIHITRANTVVLGLGLPTLLARNGVTAIAVDDVDGVVIGGLLIDAGPTNSSVLMQVGPPGSTADHSANPTSLHDMFFRIGGAALGQASTSLQINSNNVIGDDFWIWRADHGSGVGWTQNTAANGIVVNGNNVTIYGLAVEHFQQYQTTWNGNGGSTYFYQSECPYDVPNDSSWTPDGVTNGYSSYYVNPSVTTHTAYGIGVYCYFNVNPAVILDNAIQAPTLPGVDFTDLVTISLGGNGTISHIIDGTGNAVNSSSGEAQLGSYQ